MNNLKKIFVTSDLHLGHENSIKFDNRPFRDVEHMHEVLIRNFNATVPPDGLTYLLGDIGVASSAITKRVISQLNGTKVLILGNHDKSANSQYQCGFDVVLYGAVLYICGQRVTLSHCPLLGLFRETTGGMNGASGNENWHGEGKQSRFTFQNEGQFHLHGHIHSPNGGRSSKIEGKQYDVGVPANNYRPVSLSTIESWIANYMNSEKKLSNN